jgi:hypothetical protein
MAVTRGTWGTLLGPLSTIDIGFTERFAPWLGVNPNQNVLGTSSTNNVSNQQVNQSVGGGMSRQGAANMGGSNPKPSTGGQAGAPAGSPSGSPVPQQDQGPSQDQQYLDSLRSTFGNMRSSIEAQLPGMEADYNRVKGDVEASVGRARETLAEGKQDINRGYGENLRDLIQTDRELGQRQRGVYSANNALDSSSFLENENKRQQQLVETKGEFTRERDRSISTADREFAAYERQANDALANLGNQYMQGRQQLQSAIAQNDLNSAAAIQNAMEQIRSRAQQVADSVNALKLNAVQLQSQGVDVIGGLQRLNRGGIDNLLGQYMSSYYNPTAGQLTVPNPQVAGQGFIGSSEEQRRRLAMGY